MYLFDPVCNRKLFCNLVYNKNATGYHKTGL